MTPRRWTCAVAVLLGVLGSVVLAAPAGAATPGLCDGKAPTIVGSATIIGTDGDDVIVGSLGPDTIEGGGGNDYADGGGKVGGKAVDTVSADPGDVVVGVP